MNKVRRSQNHLIKTVKRSPGKAGNTNTVETMVFSQIHVQEFIITPHISNKHSMWKWPFSESVLENKTTFVKQRRSAFWKYRSLYDNVVVTLSQNHIEHDTLYILNSIDLLIKGMFETKDHTWIKINVPARPQTRKILKKNIPWATSQQRSCYQFSDFLWKFDVNVWASPESTFANK